MRKLLFAIALFFIANAVMAIPARPGQWQVIKLPDGTEVRAQLCGDEHVHFWMTDDGRRFVKHDDSYVAVTIEQLQQRARSHRAMKPQTLQRLRSASKVSMGERTHYTGKKKGIVILAQYSDVKFKTANNLEKYQRIMNEAGYSEGRFRGSVADYFKDQSNGQFELDFDVVGPCTLERAQSYYGKNDSYGEDLHAEEMIKEACEMADEEVDFSDYDWDGDGFVDQVFVLYAGKGEADGGSANTVWPHMYYLSAAGIDLQLDGVTIDTYACSNEIDYSGSIEGIGCFCHEFSHCMGFPDFYDVAYSGWMGMDDFDLMSSGNYNGGSFCPAGYTAHEKMMCGWKEPIVLSNEDVTVDDIQPMSANGDTYIIYNDAHPDEYFMIENRQKSGWDTSYPAKGLMITHVDFDKEIWEYNIPNTKITASSDYHRYYGYPVNTHMRMQVVAADNRQNSTTVANDLFPYGKLDSLSCNSKPAATFYNKNEQGATDAAWAILNISQNADGGMSFTYRAPVAKTEEEPEEPPVADYLFYESFNQCNGTGGNDNLWSGIVASAPFVADNEGWEALSNKMYGANKCAKFGVSSTLGIVTTPAFTVDGTATLTFKASAWDHASDGTTLLLESEEADIYPMVFTLNKGEWTDCEAIISGKGTITITFTPDRRFFLDEVLVVEAETPTAIQTVASSRQSSAQLTFDLQGRLVSGNNLPKGIYIRNGKKIIVK